MTLANIPVTLAIDFQRQGSPIDIQLSLKIRELFNGVSSDEQGQIFSIWNARLQGQVATLRAVLTFLQRIGEDQLFLLLEKNCSGDLLEETNHHCKPSIQAWPMYSLALFLCALHYERLTSPKDFREAQLYRVVARWSNKAQYFPCASLAD